MSDLVSSDPGILLDIADTIYKKIEAYFGIEPNSLTYLASKFSNGVDYWWMIHDGDLYFSEITEGGDRPTPEADEDGYFDEDRDDFLYRDPIIERSDDTEIIIRGEHYTLIAIAVNGNYRTPELWIGKNVNEIHLKKNDS